ncbi:hypothetical protein Zmor_003519 [Zophobas morio]|uniref:Uncharacterized protein n=1 Tax=Zophobas morio TaxID=2755281 RepID=A0AA38M1D2_9CUCU|nr:hypothetical protein Zmor_003519 [Zophobas morio]
MAISPQPRVWRLRDSIISITVVLQRAVAVTVRTKDGAVRYRGTVDCMLGSNFFTVAEHPPGDLLCNSDEGISTSVARGCDEGPERHIKWPALSLTVSYSDPSRESIVVLSFAHLSKQPSQEAFLAASLCLLFFREPINYCRRTLNCYGRSRIDDSTRRRDPLRRSPASVTPPKPYDRRQHDLPESGARYAAIGLILQNKQGIGDKGQVAAILKCPYDIGVIYQMPLPLVLRTRCLNVCIGVKGKGCKSLLPVHIRKVKTEMGENYLSEEKLHVISSIMQAVICEGELVHLGFLGSLRFVMY